LSILDRLLFAYVFCMVILLFFDILGITVFYSFPVMIFNIFCTIYLNMRCLKGRDKDIYSNNEK